MDELDLQITNHEWESQVQCPNCGVYLMDDCPPDIDMDKEIECPKCGTALHIDCSVSIEREYTVEEKEDN